MNGFRSALGEVADRAKVYDVTERAVRVVGRRRRVARLAPVAAAVAVVVVGLVAVAGLRPNSGTDLEVAAPPTVTWLPARLDLPARAPDPLPATGVIGNGVLVYGSSAGGAEQPVLLTEDGRHLRLAEPVTTAGGTSYTHPTLSPDGRWLGEQRGGRYVVRDLTGTARFDLDDGYAPVAWAPNSRWLLLVDNRNDDAAPLRLDLVSGGRVAVPLGNRNQWRAVAVLPGGEVLINGINGDNTQHRFFEARIVDPASGAERPPIRFAMGMYLLPDESRTWDPPLLSPDGRTVVLAVVPAADPEQGVPALDAGAELLMVDLTTWQIRLTALPHSDEAPPAGTGPTPMPARDWWTEPLAYLPEGLLVRLRTADQRGEALQILDPVTGAVGTVTELPDRTKTVDQVLTRGG